MESGESGMNTSRRVGGGSLSVVTGSRNSAVQTAFPTLTARIRRGVPSGPTDVAWEGADSPRFPPEAVHGTIDGPLSR